MEYPHCQGLGSQISKDFREIRKTPEMMPVGITFVHHTSVSHKDLHVSSKTLED